MEMCVCKAFGLQMLVLTVRLALIATMHSRQESCDENERVESTGFVCVA